MKLNRGCGCLSLILAVVNALVVFSVLYTMISGNVAPLLAVLMMVVFAGNVAICLVTGLPSLRRTGGVTSTVSDQGEDVDAGELEGEGEDEDQ
jgi:uncharacterized membrane protein